MVLFFLIDFSFGSLLRYLYFRQDSGVLYGTTYSIEKTSEDMLILGSSRANHHYDPEIFEKRMDVTCYNAGRDGCPIFYHFAILKGVLERYSPGIIILDFTRGEFAKTQDSYDRIAALLPYFRTHPEIHSVIRLKNRYENLKLISECYPFNSSLLTILNSKTKIVNENQDNRKGFIPLGKTMNGPALLEKASQQYELDLNKISTYRSFIEGCINSNIKIYIVASPYYINSEFPDYSIMIGKDLAKEYNIDFFDYSGDPLFIKDASLFADFAHLNERGATIFSNLIIEKIYKDKTEVGQ
jgi:hypothetical protein